MIKKNYLGFLGMLALALAIFGVMPAEAAFSTNLTDIVTDAAALFTSVQTLAITIISFGIAVWVINKLRRR